MLCNRTLRIRNRSRSRNSIPFFLVPVRLPEDRKARVLPNTMRYSKFVWCSTLDVSSIASFPPPLYSMERSGQVSQNRQGELLLSCKEQRQVSSKWDCSSRFLQSCNGMALIFERPSFHRSCSNLLFLSENLNQLLGIHRDVAVPFESLDQVPG